MLTVLAALAMIATPPQLAISATGQALALSALGKGAQIYRCTASPDGSSYDWTLVGPDAVLTDGRGSTLGRHYPGPTWEAADGSKVVGKVEAKASSPTHSGVDWLLLKAVSTSGPGVFAHVTYVRRLNTAGGQAPAQGCAAADAGAEVRAPYSATYEFYQEQR